MIPLINDSKAEKILKYLDEIQDIIHSKHHELAIKYNLTVEEFHILLHLQMKTSSPTVNELAASFNNASNTMSEKLTRLENKELIIKIKDNRDRRIYRITLTQKGKKIIDDICYEAENSFVTASISKIDEKELDTLILSLQNIIKQLKEDNNE